MTNFLQQPVPDKIEPDAICCANCEAFLAYTKGRVGVCARNPPVALVRRYVIETVPNLSAVKQVLEGQIDGFYAPTLPHWRCFDGFKRRSTNGAAVSLDLPPEAEPLVVETTDDLPVVTTQ